MYGAFLTCLVLAAGLVPAARAAQGAAPDADSTRSLFEAVQRRDASSVVTLISDGANVGAVRIDGSTPLSWAALRDDGEITRALLGAGANPNVADENGETPLLLACAAGNLRVARMLLDAGADIGATRWSGDGVLHAATHAGRIALVRLLLDRGAEVNVAETRMGQTPLMWAVAAPHPDIARLLIARGADVSATSTNGFSPLLFAAEHGDAETAAALVAAGADLHARTEQAADRGDLPFQPRRGLTPFLAAAQTGNVEMMRALMALGADPAALTPDGAGAVLLAAGSRRLEAVQMVVELGLDVNRHPDARPSALHTAVRFGSDDIVEYLAAHGADFEARDNFGRTPLEEAEFEAPSHTIELVRRLSAERQRGRTQ